ncbi:hypothetical protein GCM10018787_37230 [Streptomyces thermodiastaticus]|nr:hypothetical protein GCM10018787_37230 [Streptomyces thermodiastaticus]
MSTTFAATAACPSPNTVAVTWNDSPVTAFAGCLPPATAGRTSRTGMRPTTGTVLGVAPTDVTSTAVGPGTRPAGFRGRAGDPGPARDTPARPE